MVGSAAVLGLLGAVICAGCGSRVEGASSCGPSYVVHAPGRTITNTCAGTIPGPMRFSVPSGRRFSIDIGHEESGKLDFPIPAPVGPGVRLLTRRGAVITYKARIPGVTRLVARHTIYCASGHGRRFRSCAAAIVRVTAN
jgi:hypothetical protein